jgi:hypothetical protein
MICTRGLIDSRTSSKVAYDCARRSTMRQVMRQVGIVIGLTVILTFPVTVVSGAGSQKHSDHLVRTSPSEWTTAAQAKRVLDPGSDSEAGGPTPRR